ncbi:MAG TPA: hypothetical protein VLT13_12510, partial [Bacteroidota bacterium]|nr:hypothetical protein [Bacteroidota bacterium]
MNSRILLMALLLILAAQIVRTQIPKTISYQCVLTDATGKTVPDGNYTISFRLYDVALAGTALWSESQTIPVAKGMVNAIIGSATLLNLPFDKQYWLGVTVGTGSELTPRLLLTSSAYGFRAEQANGLGGFGISPIPQPNMLL